MSANNNPRVYATIVYPESAPEGWKEILDSMHIEAFISPLHDKDKYESDGEGHKKGDIKKSHYHVMLMFGGKKSPDQVSTIIKEFGGVGMEVVKNTKGMARYLCHLDNKEKAQYSIGDVISMAGANYEKACKFDEEDPMRAVEEMIDFCEKKNITNFYILSRYARDYRKDWHRVLVQKSTQYIREFLKAKEYAIKTMEIVKLKEILAEGKVEENS